MTTDPNTITNPQPFDGGDTVGVGNGAGLVINSIGSSIVYPHSLPASQFHLKDIVNYPQASANLLSINNFVVITNASLHSLTPIFL